MNLQSPLFSLSIVVGMAVSATATSQEATKVHLSSPFYPMGDGDYWEYFDYASYGGGVADTIGVTVTGDTLIHSISYKMFHTLSTHYHYHDVSLERFDSLDNLLRFDPNTDSDVVKFRLGDISSSPWIRGSEVVRFDSCLTRDIFGLTTRVLYANSYSLSDTNFIQVLSQQPLAQGIGILGTLWWYGEGASIDLMGARINGVIYGTITFVPSSTISTPSDAELLSNFPNPFNPSTTITFSVNVRGRTKLVVYDLLGREVAMLVSERKPAGSYNVQFDAFGLASGVYFYRLEAGKFVRTRKMVVLK